MKLDIITDTVNIKFSKKNSIDGIFILNDSTKVCAGNIHKFIIRTHNAVSDPIVLEKEASFNLVRDCAEALLEDPTGKYRALVRYSKMGRGIKVNIELIGPKPIWLAEYQIIGFDFEEIIVPALGGQSINKEMPEGKTLSYKYPFWWNAQFVIGCLAADLRGGVRPGGPGEQGLIHPHGLGLLVIGDEESLSL